MVFFLCSAVIMWQDSLIQQCTLQFIFSPWVAAVTVAGAAWQSSSSLFALAPWLDADRAQFLSADLNFRR